MREINAHMIAETVERLLISANYTLPSEITHAVRRAKGSETGTLAQSILDKMEQNMAASEELHLPVCQDTGMAVVYLKVGQEVHITGSLAEAVHQGVKNAYENGHLRKSIVADPFERVNTQTNAPAVLYTELVSGDQIEITCAPKGFGSENMSRIKMFNPTASRQDVLDFIVDCVRRAGGNPCPPVAVGVGIGGTFDYAAVLSKKALVREELHNACMAYREMEIQACEAMNALGIGPQGLGGDTTAFFVKIEAYPTHIAGLPVAVNIGCHVNRHASAIL